MKTMLVLSANVMTEQQWGQVIRSPEAVRLQSQFPPDRAYAIFDERPLTGRSYGFNEGLQPTIERVVGALLHPLWRVLQHGHSSGHDSFDWRICVPALPRGDERRVVPIATAPTLTSDQLRAVMFIEQWLPGFTARRIQVEFPRGLMATLADNVYRGALRICFDLGERLDTFGCATPKQISDIEFRQAPRWYTAEGPQDMQIMIPSPVSGYAKPVAQLVNGHTLLILTDLFALPREHQLTILEKILFEMVLRLPPDTPLCKGLQVRHAKEQMLKRVTHDDAQAISRVNDRLEAATRQEADLTAKLAETSQAREADSRTHAQLVARRATNDWAARVAWERLEGHPLISSVQAFSDWVIVHTHPMGLFPDYVINPLELRFPLSDLGSYSIVEVGGSRAQCHPMVMYDGRLSSAHMNDLVTRLVGRGNLTTAIEILLDLLPRSGRRGSVLDWQAIKAGNPDLTTVNGARTAVCLPSYPPADSTDGGTGITGTVKISFKDDRVRFVDLEPGKCTVSHALNAVDVRGPFVVEINRALIADPAHVLSNKDELFVRYPVL